MACRSLASALREEITAPLGIADVAQRHVLVHTAGGPELWPDIAPEDLGDWDRVCAFIADQRPWWQPGAATGYHARHARTGPAG
jgi:Beta-lactamase